MKWKRTTGPGSHSGWLYVASVTGVIPVAIVLLVEDPVAIMSASGTIGALHTPFIVFLILLVNRLHLPDELRPGALASALLATAGIFYALFAVLRMTVQVD